MVADIHASTYDLRLGILKSRCAQLGATVPEAVLEFLSLKVTSNIRELEGALNRIVAHADVTKSEITLESTQDVLQDLLRSSDRRITIDEIQRRVAEHYNVRITDMHSSLSRPSGCSPASSGDVSVKATYSTVSSRDWSKIRRTPSHDGDARRPEGRGVDL